MRVLRNQKSQTSNLTRGEQMAYRNLRNDRSVVITNQAVIMDRTDYEKKALEHLLTGPHEKLPEQKRRAILNKTQALKVKILQELKPKLGKRSNTVFEPMEQYAIQDDRSLPKKNLAYKGLDRRIRKSTGKI
ncbi:unnamed protein product [Echinostoma caproni]|uniref:Uncharacterized protein n=1 Tax=Echinostoma caproni TaxID=27848 RepID=A0A183B0G2_9TREM|nr:unnamed protein product [Echinostoma caproni]